MWHGLTDSVSTHSTGSFTYNITQQTPDATDNTLYYHGAGTYDGAGADDNDTLVMMDYRSTANAVDNNIDFHADYGADFTHPASATTPTIRNVETIDLSAAGGDHTIANLTAQDVLDMTANNSTHVLTINGDKGDTVNLADVLSTDTDGKDISTDGSWNATTSAYNVDGHNYTDYSGTSADGTAVTVRIEDAIIKQLIQK
jgi:hypothetical protein